MVHGSMLASSVGKSFVAPQYFCFHNDWASDKDRVARRPPETPVMAGLPRSGLAVQCLTSMPKSARVLGDPDLSRLSEFRGQLVSDVVGVSQLGDLTDVDERFVELDVGSVGESQAVGVQDRSRRAA
jgi:hypothetical protein